MGCARPLDSSAAPASPGDSGDGLEAMRRMAPASLQDQMRRAVAQMAGERKPVTILFTDIVGSTAHAQRLDPEDWKEIVSGAHQRVSEAVYRYEGHVAQLLGDGVLAYFGAPIAHEDDPVRAVQAALDIQAAIQAYAAVMQKEKRLDRLEMRVGINSGPVVVDRVGGDLHAEYLAVGDAVNLAARMQTAALPGKVLLSEATFKSVSQVFDCADLGSIEVKGKSEPVRVFQVRQAKARQESGRGIDDLAGSMVGRAQDLKALLEASRLSTTQKSGHVALLLGEPGLGKSRLIAEWRAASAAHGQIHAPATWAEGQALSYGQGLAYHLLISTVRSLLGMAANASEAESQQAVTTAAQELLGASASESQPFLASLLGMKADGDSGETGRQLDPRSLQAQYLGVIRRLVLAVAARGTLVLVLEDVHWADPSSADLLARLLPLVLEAPVIFCISARPEPQSPGWKLVEAAQALPGAHLTELSLQALSTADSEQLISNLIDLRGMPDELRQLILAKSEGNPLFVEEVIRLLIDTRVLIRIGSTWSAKHEAGRIEIPDTLQRLLLARIDRLPDEPKFTLRVAAVIGRQFPVDVLYAVMSNLARQTDRRSLDENLQVLERSSLLQPAPMLKGVEYLFRHALMQEAAYEAVLKADRRRLHRVVGQVIESLLGKRLDELASTLAFHFERAEEWEAAHRWLARAGTGAYRQWALPEAAGLLRRALILETRLSGRQALEFELRFQLARTIMILGEPREDVLAEYERCLTLAPDQRSKADVLYHMGQLLHIYTSSDLDAAEGYYSRALDLLPDQSGDVLRGTVTAYLGYLFRYQKRIPRAIETLSRALELARRIGSVELETDCHIFLSGAYLDAGREDDALQAGLQGLELARRVGNIEVNGRAHSFCSDVFLGRAYAGRGLPEDALPHLKEMQRFGREYGIGVLAAFGAHGMGAYHELQGDLEAALHAWREGIRIWQASRSANRVAYCHARCGQILLHLGQLDAAGDEFEAVRENCGPSQTSRADFYVGAAYAGAGLDVEACDYLQRAFDTVTSSEQRSGWVEVLRTEAEFARHRSLPGVAALLAKFPRLS